MKPKAYSYIRMSSELQLGGDSLRRQLQRSAEFAAKNGLELVDPIQDLGVSAFRGNNIEFGELRRFLTLVEEGRVAPGTFLIVESLDRLSRANVTKAFTLLLSIVSNGIHVATLSDGQIYTSETLDENSGQIFMALGSMLRAHDESRTKSQRIVAAWTSKRVAARDSKRLLTRTVPLWLKVSPKKDRIDVVQERADVVREIFELTRDGWGATSIAKRFNERGYPAWGLRPKKDRGSGKSIWHESYVKKILTNRAVLGELQPHRVEHSSSVRKGHRVPQGEKIIDYYPRVVSDDLFLAAKAAVSARASSGRGRKGSSFRNLFSGLLYCGACGRSMRFLDKGTVKRGASQWLTCTNRRLGGGCNARPWRYLPFETAFIRFMKHIDAAHLLGGERRDQKVASLRHELLRTDELLASNERKLANLVAALSEGGSSAIGHEIRRLEQEQREAELRRNSLDLELGRVLSTALVTNRGELMKLLNRIAVRRDRRARLEERRAFSAEIRRVVKRVELFSQAPPDPWMADSEMEMEMLERLSEHALRERLFSFRVEYLSGESETIFPYRNFVPTHVSQRLRRDSSGRFRT
jgi:DNA invertase Pin-like site-specific DNA recombinase